MYNLHLTDAICKLDNEIHLSSDEHLNLQPTRDFLEHSVKLYVIKDGNMWMCAHADFVNLRESDCYAFGNTELEAFENYVITTASKLLQKSLVGLKAVVVAKFEKTFPTYDHSKYADGTYISLRTGNAYQLFEAGYRANT